MSRNPSRPAPTSHPSYLGTAPEHSSSQPYSHPPRPSYIPAGSAPPMHPPVDRDPYHRPPDLGDPYYYPHHAPHQYGPSPHHPGGYRVSPAHPVIRPHPPAPPAPPRPQQYRESHGPPQGQGPPLSPRPMLIPTFNYYRAHAEYDTQHAPPRPKPVLEDDGRRVDTMHQDGRPRGRSASSGSGYGSGVPGEAEHEQETTPSPVDPDRIHAWEEAQGPSRRPPSGSGSYHENDIDDDDESDRIVDSSLGGEPHGYYSPSSHEHGYDMNDDDSPMDDVPMHNFQGFGDVSGTASLHMPNSQRRANSDYYPSPHHTAQFAALTQQTGPVNSQRGRIGLNSLVDGEPGDRPAYPIPTIIKCAILGSPHQQLTLSELYLAMEMRFDYYRNSDKKSWRNSVRHNLSLNNQFEKKARPITEPGKGHYWVVVPDMPQGNKRERKRNKKPGKRALAAIAAEAERLAREQTGGGENVPSAGPSTSATSNVPVDPHLTATTAVYPAAVRGHTTGTLPANAGSYAAVTGALPAPTQPDRQLYRPWNGLPPPNQGGSEPVATLATTLQGHQYNANPRQRTTPIVGGAKSARSPVSGGRERATNTQPQFGESSLRPAAFTSPTRRLPGTSAFSRQSGSGSTESSTSGGGAQRSATTRGERRFDPTSPIQTLNGSAPTNAFTALAAQIEREGLGATGSGGPGLSARGKRDQGKGRARPDDSDSDGDDLPSDDEYLPSKHRNR